MSFLKKALQSDYLTLGLCVVLTLISALITPGFATGRNAINVLTVAAPLMLLALGQMLVMISGGIDLSVTAILAAASVYGAKCISSDGGLLHDHWFAVPAVMVLMPLVGTAFGIANGTAIAWLRLPPFIVTLTSMMFLFGLATWYTRSENIAGLPQSFLAIAANPWFSVLLAAGLASLVSLGLQCTIFGRWLYAIGQNEQTSFVSGVPVRGVVNGVYVLSGFFAGVAALIYTAQLETGSPVLGRNMLLDVIGAVVIGGTSLFGGKGKVSWTLGGVMFIAILDNVLNLQSLSHFAVMIAKGTLIIAAAMIDSLQSHWSDS